MQKIITNISVADNMNFTELFRRRWKMFTKFFLWFFSRVEKFQIQNTEYEHILRDKDSTMTTLKKERDSLLERYYAYKFMKLFPAVSEPPSIYALWPYTYRQIVRIYDITWVRSTDIIMF